MQKIVDNDLWAEKALSGLSEPFELTKLSRAWVLALLADIICFALSHVSKSGVIMTTNAALKLRNIKNS